MKSPEFLELISVINQLDHYQRSVLTTTLTQLSDEPKVSELIETAFDAKGICPYCLHQTSTMPPSKCTTRPINTGDSAKIGHFSGRSPTNSGLKF